MTKKRETEQIDVEKLAARLRYTNQNVYRLHEMLFSKKCGEEVFALLEQKAALFKCEECDTWKPLDERDMSYGDDEDSARMCFECSGNQNDEDE